MTLWTTILRSGRTWRGVLMDSLTRTAAPAAVLDGGIDLEVIIVDDRQLIRECVGWGLRVIEPTLVVTYLSRVDEFDELGPQLSGRPRIVLINITPSNGIDLVLEQMLRIKGIDPAVNVIVL